MAVTAPLITALYAGLSGIWLLVVSLNVVRHRVRARVGIGDGGDAGLHQAIRVQGNATEYLPLALVILMLCEMLGAPAFAIHGIGAALVTGRVLHAIGLSRSTDRSVGRAAGMLLTWLPLLGAALLAVYLFVAGSRA